jgi:hypothetical protein
VVFVFGMKPNVDRRGVGGLNFGDYDGARFVSRNEASFAPRTLSSAALHGGGHSGLAERFDGSEVFATVTNSMWAEHSTASN